MSALHFSDYCTASPREDLLRQLTLHPEPGVRYRDASAAAVYGPHASTGTLRPAAPAEAPLTDNALFQGIVLLVGVAYVLLVYHNLADFRTLLNQVFRDPASDKHTFQEPTGSNYLRFLRTSVGLGLLLTGLCAVKWCQPATAELLFGRFPVVAAPMLCLTVAAVGGAVFGFQWLLLRTVGILTLTEPLLAQLRQLRKRYFSAAVLLVMPAMLLYLLAPQRSATLWFVLIIIGLAIMLFLYLKEALTLFLAKKVSFVHWFLYLCTVELFPVSLLWQLALRGGV